MVGDGEVGKTSLLYVFARDIFLEVHIPTVMEAEMVQMIPSVKPGSAVELPPSVEMKIWDTAGQEDYDKIRPLAYGQTDIFIICFR